jgi:hypothetical protein
MLIVYFDKYYHMFASIFWKQKLVEMRLFYASIRKKDGEMMKKSSSCTSINSQVRNEYNYSAGPNVLNTYRNKFNKIIT